MTKLQIAILLAAVGLLFVLYFGCNTKSSEIQDLEKTRSLMVKQTNIDRLLQDARKALTDAQMSKVLLLEAELNEKEASDTSRIALNKELSSEWFQLGFPAVAGYYAQQAAELENTEESWSIAGTTYILAIRRLNDDRKRTYCRNRAVTCFENAISINPDNIKNRVNLALCYTEYPLQDDPMKGVLMLRTLNQNYPQSVPVLNTLGRLAIKTGQYGKAIERLEEALKYEPSNPTTVCLLANAYESNGDAALATAFSQKCSKLFENREEN